MMFKLPIVSGREAARAFVKAGFEFNHQRGSHMVYRRTQAPHTHLSIPDHKELARGTLRGLIRDAGLTVEQFVDLLN